MREARWLPEIVLVGKRRRILAVRDAYGIVLTDFGQGARRSFVGQRCSRATSTATADRNLQIASPLLIS